MSVTAILPSDRETADLVPGDFTATNGEGDSERLQSFGEISFGRRNVKKNHVLRLRYKLYVHNVIVENSVFVSS